MIDLITTLDMTSFQAHNGLQAFINRLEVSESNAFVLVIGTEKVGGSSSYRSISMTSRD